MFAHNLRTFDKIMVHRLDTSHLCAVDWAHIPASKGTREFLRAESLPSTLSSHSQPLPMSLSAEKITVEISLRNLLGNPGLGRNYVGGVARGERSVALENIFEAR